MKEAPDTLMWEAAAAPGRLAEPPAELLRRPVHQWRFRHRWTAGDG